MTKTFGESLQASPSYVSPNANDVPTDQLLHDRFMFHRSVLRNYVKHSHEVEGLSKSEIQSRVDPMASRVVEKYGFGSLFISDINKYISDRFMQPAAVIQENIRKDANIPDDVFDKMMAELASDPSIESFSSKFKMILK